jgi:hypothetical protein
VKVMRGDYSAYLKNVCAELEEACNYAASDLQREYLKSYIESFRSGNLDAYRHSQRLWVQDKAPRVENIFGFVEPYRDPHGTRAEFEALVGIPDDKETELLAKLVENSTTFIRRLPWATAENDGKGPFEKTLFEAPDFSSIHSEWKYQVLWYLSDDMQLSHIAQASSSPESTCLMQVTCFRISPLIQLTVCHSITISGRSRGLRML